MQMSTASSLNDTKQGGILSETLTFWARHLRVLMRLLPSDVGAVHLLQQNPNYSDEEDEVHLPGGGGGGGKPGQVNRIMRGGGGGV